MNADYLRTAALVAAFFLSAPSWAAIDEHPQPKALTEAQETSIYALAYGQYGGAHGGMPMPARPLVVVHSREQICMTITKKPDCPYYGYYVDGGIVISKTLDFSSLIDASKLLHEYVHYLQDQRLGVAKEGCEEWLEREWEAYFIQYNVLTKAGQYLAAQMVRGAAQQVRCVDSH